MIEKLESLIKSAVGKDNAKSALAFMITLDIIREIEIYSLSNKVVRVLFSSLESVKGVEILKDEKEIASYGDTTSPFMELPLTSGYILRIYVDNNIDNENLNFLRYIQALLSYHIYNILELQKLKEKAMFDSLTGAYARSIGEELLKKHFQAALRGKRFSLIFVDIDNLKYINDSYGHDEGDKYLRQFVDSFRENAREEDVVIRWGGDEFILIFEGATKENAQFIINRISTDFEGSFSYGIVSVPCEAIDMHKAIKIADERMYKAKYSKKISTK